VTYSKYTGRIRVEDLSSSDWLVPPSGTYRATCLVRDDVVFVNEILVQDFALVELYVGNHFVPTKEHAARVVGSRLYRLESADMSGMNILGYLDVALVLKNDTNRSLRIRKANFEEERRA